MKPEPGRVLVVDDNEANRDLLARRVRRQGHRVTLAEDGLRALELMQQEPFDLVLLDIMMPQMNGYQVLEHLKSDPNLRDIPVIVISALDDINSVVECIELGAEDYLPKPFNAVLLAARISNCLEKKRLRDRERLYLEQLQAEKERAEQLLLNILPMSVAEQLKQGQHTIADNFAEVSVLFADIVDFTRIAARHSPTEVVRLLNQIFSTFDRLAEQHGVEKIKTIGDSYMAVGGLPTPRLDHAEAIAEMALDMLDKIARFQTDIGEPITMRIGINSGPVVAGVIGTKKFIYDLWGDTVNIASRMESYGLAGCVQVSPETYKILQDKYVFKERGVLPIKGKGDMKTYILTGRKIY
jgi:adenylate cyclase